MDAINADEVMFQRALDLLQNPEATTSELEWARKALNDYSNRRGNHALQGHKVSDKFKVDKLQHLELDEVPRRIGPTGIVG